MLNKLRAFVKAYDLISPGDHVTVAVSGGKDSVALLFALYLLRDEWSITLEAVHFNHHLRGEESQRDARFAADFCGRYDIPLTIGEGWVRPGEKGLEAAAREARYRFFRSLPGKIATAHTAEDNAETVLLRMIRGTGLKGLGAIAPQNGNVIRPLLSASREEVQAFLEEYSLPHVEDSSNGTDAFLRNRIRHDILPLLQRENPRIGENLSAMALGLRLDEACLQELASGPLPPVSKLRQLAPALRRRYLDRFLKESGVREPEESHILQAEQLVFHWNPSASMDFPGGIVIARQYDTLVRKDQSQPLEERMLGPETDLEDLGLSVTVKDAEALVQGPDTFTVVPHGPLRLRPRQSGDSICLPGGTKSLKKLFIDRKIPAAQRDRIPVVCDDLGIIGVLGIGPDRRRQAEALPAKTVQFVRKPEDIFLEEKEHGGKSMDKDILKVLITEDQIRSRIAELGEELTRDYEGKDPVIVGVLKGVVVFYADMIRQIKTPCQMDFMWISSYAGTTSTGQMQVKKDISVDIKGRHVLILEDIFDTGHSLDFTYKHLMSMEPASLKICTFLDKPARRLPGIDLKPEYVGYTVPNEFVVGYGLDFNEHYRNLPYIGVLKPEAYA